MIAMVVSVIMTITAAAGRPICADVQYRPGDSPTPASLLLFFFVVPLLLSHSFSPLSLPLVFPLTRSSAVSTARCPAVIHLTPSGCGVAHSL